MTRVMQVDGTSISGTKGGQELGLLALWDVSPIDFRTALAQERLAELTQGTTDTGALFTIDGRPRRYDVITRTGIYLELKFGNDKLQDWQLKRDVDLLRHGGRIDDLPVSIKLAYVFISDPVSGRHVWKGSLLQLDNLGIPYVEFGWDFWSSRLKLNPLLRRMAKRTAFLAK